MVLGTNLANKFLRANGITLFKVRDEIVNVLGIADMFSLSPERPPITDDALRALDWAVEKKLKSGLLLPFFSFPIVCHYFWKSEMLLAYKTYITLWICMP